MKMGMMQALLVTVFFVTFWCYSASATKYSNTLSSNSIGQYQKLELTITGLTAPDNPFDPSQIDVSAEFRTPSRKIVRVPGFWFQSYTRTRDASGAELLTPAGDGVFKVRFAWGEIGNYRYRVLLREGANKARSIGSGKFNVTWSRSRGFVRRSEKAPLYFQYDSGAPFFAIGENVCWPGAGGTYEYDTWLKKLSDNGGNYTRLWLINEWNKLGLEHLPRQQDKMNGLGRYDQEAAWRTDYILDLAQHLNMEIMLCIDSFNSLSTGEYGQWKQYPYNAVNGGPCTKPVDFFTNYDAKRLFRQRLRYLVARWGYAAPMMAWEFWNEVDLVDGYNSSAVATWHREMATHLRSIDPWKHLITTSFANSPGDPAIDGLPQMDFVQTHSYGASDITGTIVDFSQKKADAYAKPHYFGEFGIDAGYTENNNDPTGIHLHEGLWASLMSGSAGTAMTWWWDNYVEPRNLYHHFWPIAAFVKNIDWVKENYKPIEIASVRFPEISTPSYSAVEIVPTAESWQDGSPANQPHTYVVGADGTVSDVAVLSRVQHGIGGHLAWHNPATFEVNYPVSGEFVVNVSGVSGWGGANLAISLDGTQVLTKDYPDPDAGSHDTLHQYDGAYTISVPAGRHTIVVENKGADWFYVSSYRLTNYNSLPNLRVLGLSNDHSALLWVQNREHTWRTRKAGAQPAPVDASQITLKGFRKGTFRVQQWDTEEGKIATEFTVDCTDGTLAITTPAELTTDVAYSIR